MAKRYKCRECVNFLPIEGTVYGHCKVRPIARNQGGWKTDEEFVTTRGSWACKDNFVETDKIPDVIKVCKQCGKKFVSNHGGQEFCCEECRKKWNAKQRAKQRAEDKAKKTAAKKNATRKSKQPKVPLSEVMKMAAEEHLSYGEIVIKYGL